jgi:hypothetical protein
MIDPSQFSRPLAFPRILIGLELENAPIERPTDILLAHDGVFRPAKQVQRIP